MCTLLTAYIQHVAVRHTHDGLQCQRTLAYARVAAKQYDTARNQTATEHTIEFGVMHIHTRDIFQWNIPQVQCMGHRTEIALCRRGNGARSHAGTLLSAVTGDTYLTESVPLVARRTLAQPLGGLLAAVIADVCYFVFCHVSLRPTVLLNTRWSGVDS